MPFNRPFGDIVKAITESIYTSSIVEGGFVPPPPMAEFLLDNSGESLLDNTGDELLTT